MATKKDQTSKADDQKVKPENETAEADQTAEKEQPKEQEPKIDYESKFKASQDEAMKLKTSWESLKGQWDKITPILQILNDHPDLMQQIDEVYTGSSTAKQSLTQTQIIDALLTKKLEEKLHPLVQEIDMGRKQQAEKAFAEFIKKFPDAQKHWSEIEKNLKGMKAIGYSLEEGLENAYFLTKKEEAKKQGKKEMAFEIYQRDQVAASGGSATGSASSEEALTPEEQKVAEELGLKKEDYAANKSKK